MPGVHNTVSDDCMCLLEEIFVLQHLCYSFIVFFLILALNIRFSDSGKLGLSQLNTALLKINSCKDFLLKKHSMVLI